MEQTCHTGGTRDGADSLLPGLLFCPEGVGEKILPGGLSARTLSLGIPPKGISIGQRWLERTPDTALVSHTNSEFTPPPPPWGGAVVQPRRAQLHVANADGPRVTRPQGRILTQGNVPSGGITPYKRGPIPPISDYRPPLIICGVCDMYDMTSSLSSPHWSGGPLGRRGSSGRQMLPEGGHYLVT